MRGAPGGTISGRRPLPEVPWPDGINHSSSAIDNRSASRRPSRGPETSAETCEKVLRTFSVCSGASQTAIKMRIRRCRADILRRNKLHCRAQLQIQEYRAARTIRAKTCLGCTNTIWLPPGRFSLSSLGRHVGLNLFIRATAHLICRLYVRARCICAFRSLPEAEKRPAGTFSHVSADASGPREAVGYLVRPTSRVRGRLRSPAEGPSGEGSAA